MQKFPFKTVGIYSAVMTGLIVLRGIVSVSRHHYYGGRSYLAVLQNDRWMCIGIATAALTALCFVLIRLQKSLQDDSSAEDQADEDTPEGSLEEFPEGSLEELPEEFTETEE